MFERFTSDARNLVVSSQQQARRLGHPYIGCEHLLLSLAALELPAGAVLREQGITPQRVEQEITRRAGLGAGADLFADLDRDALASIGIDIDTVRARIESAFGQDALTRAGHRCRRQPRRVSLRPWRQRRHHARRAALLAAGGAAPAEPQPAAGPRPKGHLPFTPRAKQALANSLREAVSRHDSFIGVEHLTLGLLKVSGGMVAPILSELGTSPEKLRAGILDRYRRAS